MRTIALLAMTGLMAAAEQPEKKPALNNAEQIAIRALVAEAKVIEDRQKNLRDQYQAVIADACTRVYQTPTCKLNDDGTLSKIEPPKESKR